MNSHRGQTVPASSRRHCPTGEHTSPVQARQCLKFANNAEAPAPIRILPNPRLRAGADVLYGWSLTKYEEILY